MLGETSERKIRTVREAVMEGMHSIVKGLRTVLEIFGEKSENETMTVQEVMMDGLRWVHGARGRTTVVENANVRTCGEVAFVLIAVVFAVGCAVVLGAAGRAAGLAGVAGAAAAGAAGAAAAGAAGLVGIVVAADLAAAAAAAAAELAGDTAAAAAAAAADPTADPAAAAPENSLDYAESDAVVVVPAAPPAVVVQKYRPDTAAAFPTGEVEEVESEEREGLN